MHAGDVCVFSVLNMVLFHACRRCVCLQCFKYSSVFCVQEMQQQMNVLNQKPNMPDMSEMITNYFSGGKKAVKSKGSSKRK